MSFCGGGWGGLGGWGGVGVFQSHFCVQPNNCVEVVLRCVVVGVLTTSLHFFFVTFVHIYASRCTIQQIHIYEQIPLMIGFGIYNFNL